MIITLHAPDIAIASYINNIAIANYLAGYSVYSYSYRYTESIELFIFIELNNREVGCKFKRTKVSSGS